MDKTNETCKTTSSAEEHECEWEYMQNEDYDWFECKICGKVKDYSFVP